MATHRTKREEIEAELQRLTKILGGGWSWGHHGIVPQITLTIVEAQALEKKINQETT